MRRLAFLLAVLVACAKAPEPPAPPPYDRIALEGLDSISFGPILGPTIEIATHDGGPWQLRLPVADAADPRAIAELLQAIGALRVGRVVSTDPASYASLGVDDTEVIGVAPHHGPSDVTPLLLLGTGGRHLRFHGQPEVFVAENLRRAPFERDPAAFRDRRVVTAAADDVRGVRLVVGQGPPIAARRTDARAPWTLAEGAATVGGALDPTVPETIVQGLLALEARDRADGRGPKGDLDARARIELERASGPPIVVRFGGDEGESTWLTVDGGARASAVARRAAQALVVPVAAWRDKIVVDVAPDAIKQLEVQQGEDAVILTREPGQSWLFGGKPVRIGPDQAKAQAFVTTLRGLRARAQGIPADEKATLAAPRATVTITPRQGKPIVFRIGASRDGLSPVIVQGRPGALLIADADAARLLKSQRELAVLPQQHGHDD